MEHMKSIEVLRGYLLATAAVSAAAAMPAPQRLAFRSTLGFVAADCREKAEANSTNSQERFRNSNCSDEMDMAERELSAFIAAVTQLFGPDEAKLSAEDWLDELELMDNQPRSTRQNWRAVTIAASARLADRLAVDL
jgi:hypothetical protein